MVICTRYPENDNEPYAVGRKREDTRKQCPPCHVDNKKGSLGVPVVKYISCLGGWKDGAQ